MSSSASLSQRSFGRDRSQGAFPFLLLLLLRRRSLHPSSNGVAPRLAFSIELVDLKIQFSPMKSFPLERTHFFILFAVMCPPAPVARGGRRRRGERRRKNASNRHRRFPANQSTYFRLKKTIKQNQIVWGHWCFRTCLQSRRTVSVSPTMQSSRGRGRSQGGGGGAAQLKPAGKNILLKEIYCFCLFPIRTMNTIGPTAD